MKKYEIYLPLKYNNGTEIEAEKIKQIREELVAVEIERGCGSCGVKSLGMIYSVGVE